MQGQQQEGTYCVHGEREAVVFIHFPSFSVTPFCRHTIHAPLFFFFFWCTTARDKRQGTRDKTGHVNTRMDGSGSCNKNQINHQQKREGRGGAERVDFSFLACIAYQPVQQGTAHCNERRNKRKEESPFSLFLPMNDLFFLSFFLFLFILLFHVHHMKRRDGS